MAGACVLSSLASCDSQKRVYKDFNYFQSGLDTLKVIAFEEPKIMPNDLITVQVVSGSLKQEDAQLFNLTNIGTLQNVTGTMINTQGYQVDESGNIEMPKLGRIKVAGFTRSELSQFVSNKLKSEQLVKEPIVIVKFQQFRVNVLGEVKKPGAVLFKSDKANLLEALADAGDLTDFAKREDIILMRQREGKWETFKVDLKNTAFLNTPAFQLQHNDIIYIPANNNKLKTLNVNPNLQRDFSLITTGLQTLFFLVNVYAVLRR